MHVPLGDAAKVGQLWDVIVSMFEAWRFPIFEYGGVRVLATLILTIGVARFVWSLVRRLF